MRDGEARAREYNRVVVPANEILDVARAIERYNKEHPDKRADFEVVTFMIMMRHEEDPLLALVVLARFMAVLQLVDLEGAPAWTLPRLPSGTIPTRDVVLAAAAVHPLEARENDLVFERESFLLRVLEMAEPVGSA